MQPKLSTLFPVSLQNDDVRDFDVRWDHALLSVSEMPSDMILEGLYKSKLKNSVQLQTVMALYDQETARTKEPNYHKSKTAVKLHIDQMMRTRNFRVRSDVVETGSVTKSQKRKKACVERKVGECFQWKAHGHCSKGDSCSFSHDIQASGNRGQGQRRKGRSSSPASHSKAKQTDGEGQKSSQGSGSKQENSMDKSEIPCRFRFCTNPSCKLWHTPVCLNYKSEKGRAHGDKCHFRHVEAEGKPNKKSKKGGAKGSVAIKKASIQSSRVSLDSYQRKIFSTWIWKIGVETHRQILQRHLAPN